MRSVAIQTSSPEWISPPGDNLWIAEEDMGWSRAETAGKLGWPLEMLEKYIKGSVQTSLAIAEDLSRVLGGSVEFWLAREKQYRLDIERLEHAATLRELRTERDIKRFAEELHLHPGIVVGRMQHEEILPYNRMNELKASLSPS